MEKHNQLQPRQHSQVVYAKTNPKILVSNPKNFFRANSNSTEFSQEKPMTLNAWTQTTNDDFEYLITEEQLLQRQQQQQQKQLSAQQNENERKLLEKIRVLEENLRVHSELLSQIHATSGGRFSLQKQQRHQQKQHQQQQQQQQQQEQEKLQRQSQQHNSNYSPPEIRHKIASPNTTSLINQFQQGPKESIKYTIIAEGGSNHENDEPIEIHLAEEDGALNLNSSADSGRLEIYIADENAEVKSETILPEEQISQIPPTSLPTPTSTPLSTHYIKRRKVDMDSSSSTIPTDVSNDPQNLLTPISGGLKYKTSSGATASTKKKILPYPLKIAKVSPTDQKPIRTSHDSVMVSLGPNNTLIPEEVFQSIPWKSASIATRRLLMTIFDRNTLATHSMTGKPSPAFKDQNKPLKKMLDRSKIEDILFAVTMKCGVSEKEVRNAITTKCADENKMMKLQMGKNHVLDVVNKENVA